MRPGTRQLAIFAGAYLLYSAGRFVAVGDLDVATDNAHAIVDLERSVGADVEGGVQNAFDGSLALWILNHLYLAAQLIVVPGALIWLYRSSSEHYRMLRNWRTSAWSTRSPSRRLSRSTPT